MDTTEKEEFIGVCNTLLHDISKEVNECPFIDRKQIIQLDYDRVNDIKKQLSNDELTTANFSEFIDYYISKYADKDITEIDGSMGLPSMNTVGFGALVALLVIIGLAIS